MAESADTTSSHLQPPVQATHTCASAASFSLATLAAASAAAFFAWRKERCCTWGNEEEGFQHKHGTRESSCVHLNVQ